MTSFTISPWLTGLLPLALLSAPATSQSSQHQFIAAASMRGKMSAWPAGLRVTGGSSSAQLLVKKAGDQSLPPDLVPSPAGADDSTKFNDIEFVPAAQVAKGIVIEIDAHCTGHGVFPELNEDYDLEIDSRWFALTVSVANGVTGVPGSHFQGASAGAELSTYYFPGSQGIASKLIGNTVLEMGRTETGFSAMGIEDVEALDFGAAAMMLAGEGTDFFPNTGTYYFSVSPSFVTSYGNSAFWAEPSSDTRTGVPHAADIYVVTHGATGWSVPRMFRTHTELGFLESGNLDALLVNPSGAVIYSGEDNDEFDTNALHGDPSQLMYFYLGGVAPPSGGSDPKPTALRDGEGTDVTTRIGTPDTPGQGGDDNQIDAVCGIDPDGVVTATENIAIVTDPIVATGAPLGFSAMRLPRGGQNDRLVIQATGGLFLNTRYSEAHLYERVGTGPGVIIGTQTRNQYTTLNEWSFLVPKVASSPVEVDYWVVMTRRNGSFLGNSLLGTMEK